MNYPNPHTHDLYSTEGVAKTVADIGALGLTAAVLDEVATERQRQEAKHGNQFHLPNGTGSDLILRDLPECSTARADQIANWAKTRCQQASQNEGGDGSITYEHILTEEWAEAIAERDPARLRQELVQVAAVAVQWIEAIDRRAARLGEQS